MSAYNKFNQFVKDIGDKVHNLGSDVLKVALSNVAPVATNAVFGDITEIAAGNGYSAGGAIAAYVSDAQSTGTYKLIVSPVIFTAAGGSIATFRYAVLYNSTPTSPLKPLIAWFDYGSGLVITDTNKFLVDFSQTTGLFTFT